MRIFIRLILLTLLSTSISFAEDVDNSEPQELQPPTFSELISGLTTKKFDEKAVIIENIGAMQDERSLLILKSLLEGKVYYRKTDKHVVIAEIIEKQADISTAATGETLGTIAKKELKKVGINNKLRRALKAAIARLSLADDDPKVRRTAVIEMFKDIDTDTAALLKTRIDIEQDENVNAALRTAIAISELKIDDSQKNLAAIEYLSTSLHSEARVALNEFEKKLANKDQDSDVIELRESIAAALRKIESSVGVYKQVENIFFGVSLGSVLLLAAVGLAITFGVMGVINMAHGEMLMLGAYTTYIVQQVLPNHIEYSLLISIPTAFMFTAMVGIAIERGVIRFLYGRPLETLLATFGISLILQQAVRTIISPQNRAVATPDWMSGSLEINPALSLTYNRLYIIIFALLVLAGLMLLLSKTNFGLQVRAVTQNRSMAKAMGIRTDWVDAFTFGLGSGIAGMAGVALSQLTNVGPNLGQAYIIDSFMVVVFGGVGNLWGTLFGAMTLGIANKYLEPFTGAVLAKILVLVFIILFIQKKPRGMFALKGRSAET